MIAVVEHHDNSLSLHLHLDAARIQWTQKAGRRESDLQLMIRFASASGNQIGKIPLQTIHLTLAPEHHAVALRDGSAGNMELQDSGRGGEAQNLVLDRTSGEAGTLSLSLRTGRN